MKKPTRYKGYYIDVRDDQRYGITFTYEVTKNGKLFNEMEESVIKLDKNESTSITTSEQKK